MSTAAQDEFNAILNSQSEHRSGHPEDDISSEDGSTTLAASSAASRDTRQSPMRSSSPTQESRSIRSSYRSRTKANDDGNDEDDDDDDDNNDDTARTNKRPAKYYLPLTYDRDAMTGPKGVIADAQAFEREKQGNSAKHNYHRTRDLTLPRAQRFEGPSPTRSRKSSTDGDGMLDSDDEEVQRWREKRVREIQMGVKERTGNNFKTSGRRKVQEFGDIDMVDGMRFLEAVERAGRGQVVVVFIYQDDSHASEIFFEHLSVIALKHNFVHFIALHCEDAGIDSAGVPALLAYRNGDKFADIMPLEAEFPLPQNNDSALEDGMRRKGILT